MRSSAVTLVSSVAILGLSMITGVLAARQLGAAGRGELAAIVVIAQTLGWIFTMGCFQSVVFHTSRGEQDAGTIAATWVAVAIPLGVAGIVIGQLLVGPLTSAQSAQTETLARLWLLTIPLTPMTEAFSGVLVAKRDFGAVNTLKIIQAGLLAVAYLALWVAGEFTIQAVLVSLLATSLVYLVLLIIRSRKHMRLSRPSRAVGISGLWYGLRAHGNNVGGQLTARLDLAIMPAILAASSVGIYSVAANLSTIVISVAGSMAMIALPLASAGDDRSLRRVCKSLHATLVVGMAIAVGLGVLAGLLVPLIYSDQFAASVEPLRILLPGAVLFAAANILISGLYGLGRPATGVIAQAIGALITVVGLLLFLRSGGVRAAAIVSTISYTSVFLAATFLYRRYSGATWRELFDLRPTVAQLARRLSPGRRQATAPVVATAGEE